MVPSRCSPIEIANCGMPCRKLVVPSSGSTIQVWLASVPSRLPPSSPMKPQPGRALGRSLQRDLQMLDLVEIVFEAAAGAARGLDHDVDEGGLLHGFGWFGAGV